MFTEMKARLVGLRLEQTPGAELAFSLGSSSSSSTPKKSLTPLFLRAQGN